MIMLGMAALISKSNSILSSPPPSSIEEESERKLGVGLERDVVIEAVVAVSASEPTRVLKQAFSFNKILEQGFAGDPNNGDVGRSPRGFRGTERSSWCGSTLVMVGSLVVGVEEWANITASL
jgi:hypothetical protein